MKLESKGFANKIKSNIKSENLEVSGSFTGGISLFTDFELSKSKGRKIDNVLACR